MTAPTLRTLLVAYEIPRPDHNSPALAEAIMSFDASWARPLDTVWVLRTSLAAVEVEALLAPHLGEDDGLIVQETRGEARLANTGLRWFRPRRPQQATGAGEGTVVPFSATPANALDKAA